MKEGDNLQAFADFLFLRHSVSCYSLSSSWKKGESGLAIISVTNCNPFLNESSCSFRSGCHGI